MPTCRSCGAPIVWGKTPSGKNMPLDAKPEKRGVIEEGVVRITNAYTPHWSTCPSAAEHRRG